MRGRGRAAVGKPVASALVASPEVTMAESSFRALLYRYLFHAWLFRDVNRGNRFERHAAWCHNQAQAHWLPRYIRRWLVLGAVLFLMGLACELVRSPVLSAAFYVPGVVALPMSVVVAVSWAGLKLLPAPLSPGPS